MPPDSKRRLDRHRDILARWPVIGESWAKAIEAARLEGAQPPPDSGPPTRADAITPLEAINRALGVSDDDGADAVARAQARSDEYPSWWKSSGG